MAARRPHPQPHGARPSVRPQLEVVKRGIDPRRNTSLLLKELSPETVRVPCLHVHVHVRMHTHTPSVARMRNVSAAVSGTSTSSALSFGSWPKRP